VDLFKTKNGTKKELSSCVEGLWAEIKQLFGELERLEALETIRDEV